MFIILILSLISIYTSKIIKIKLEKEQNKRDKLLYQQSKMSSIGQIIGNITHQWRQNLSIITTASTGIKLKKEMGLLEDEELIENHLEEGSYLFSTRLEVAYLNEEYKLNIPESDSYGTLGGFIVDFYKEIPQKGEQITIGNYRFNIEEASNKKLELVKLTLLD
jgi:predicted RND superfamily exporter protein